ncbi:MAG: hypothetical protein OXH77_02055 [Anaerolineaceae bacterium]|nr:hypothetical protein [Anaerolineaceae bacterium]
MKITEVRVETFRQTSDRAKDIQGHAHPTDPHEALQSLLTIETDEGLCGYSFGEEVGMA